VLPGTVIHVFEHGEAQALALPLHLAPDPVNPDERILIPGAAG
jgi:hypothetical protein